MVDKRQRRIDSDALSIGEVLRKPLSYRVPVYQRDFAWTNEQVDTLWDDLTAATLDGRSEYFLGAVVLSPSSDDKAREIVDGQQRLALISMLFAAVADEWKCRGDDKRAMGVFRDFLGSEDRRTGELVPKLALNEINDDVFQQLVLRGQSLNGPERKALGSSNRLLDAANTSVREKLSLWLAEAKSPEERLLDFEEFLSDQTNLIWIEVGDESDAFIIFETLNDRGLELAVSDLVKNYLFSLANANIERFKKAWAEMSLLLGGDNLTPFLRQYWLSVYEFVRERELYRALRQKVKTTAAAKQFVDRLRASADLYAALLNPEHPYWADFPSDMSANLEALMLFKLTQYRPIALAAMELWKPNDVSKLLRLLMVVSFRYTVIARQSPGLLEGVYAEAALAIRTGRAKSPAQIFAILKSVYVADDRFAEDFAARSFNKAPIARYILAEINDFIEGDKEKQVAEGSGRITLEHILPLNGGPEWRGAVPKNQNSDDFVERIGNLTLLEKGRNRGIANAGFEKKKTGAFARSSLALNVHLTQSSSWGMREIEARSRELADTAKQIWRVNY